ncbi:MAG: 23S rRNA (uracil(1939)-C(5))-methyltransferase RlmD [Chlamydiae bacterium]|nr:23S rRNA (uracil(1939)-C(5))-methyltransferase RlmD [Chlamydiota bacterium]
MQNAPEIVEVQIKNLSLKGYGIGLLPKGKEVEVAHTVPGDQVRIGWKKKRHAPQKGRLLEILTPSAKREAFRCAHVGICGGCCWQQMRYDDQLQEKMRRVQKAFAESGRIDPIIPCASQFGYRNKMEFSFSQNAGGARYLGLMIAQAEPYVFDVTECHLGPSWFAASLRAVKSWWEKTELTAYHPIKDTGTLRYLTLREGIRTHQKMAILNLSGRSDFTPSKSDLEGFKEAILSVANDVSIFLRIHQTRKGSPTQFFEMHLCGSDHILEELHLKDGPLSFKISPSSFFQPNTMQAEKLYDTALSMLGNVNTVYDLYCGTGTLGMAASRFAKKVIGIEISPEAVLDAKENCQRNSIKNMEIYQGDVGKILTHIMSGKEFVRPDSVIVDPPRAGLDPLALHHLKTLLPQKIIYISCNPLTQAENIKELSKVGYQIERIQPIDQFPHTYHIENIVCLVRI